MRKSAIYVMGMFMLIVLMSIYNIVDTQQHEEIHKAIYEDYGINATIKYTYFSLDGRMGVTTAYYKDGQCPDLCKFSNELNEIVNYNVTSVVNTALLVVMLYLFIQFLIAFKDEYDGI